MKVPLPVPDSQCGREAESLPVAGHAADTTTRWPLRVEAVRLLLLGGQTLSDEAAGNFTASKQEVSGQFTCRQFPAAEATRRTFLLTSLGRACIHDHRRARTHTHTI